MMSEQLFHKTFYEELLDLKISKHPQEEYKDAVSFLYHRYFLTSSKND